MLAPAPVHPARPIDRIRVLLVDDHEVVRAGLISLIGREDDLAVCGEAATVEATIAETQAAEPDVAVVDWSLGPHDASALVRKLCAVRPAMPVLVLSMHDEVYYASRAARAGASGYVMKHEASGKIVAAIRAVAAGERFFSEQARRALAHVVSPVPWDGPPIPRGATGRVGGAPLPWWVARVAVVAVLAAIGFALYESTLPFPFAFDDIPYLVENPLWKDVRSFLFPADFSAFANRATALGLDRDLSTNFILRPVAYFSFHLNFLAGGLSPLGFRAVNVLIHSANAALLFALIFRLLPPARGVVPTAGSTPFIAWTATLFFLVHPLQTESTTYIVQRFTSLGTFFFLGSVLLYVLTQQANVAGQARRWRRWSLATLLLGMLTKEFLVLAPLTMLMLDWLMLGTVWRVAVKRAWPWLLCLPLVPVLVLAIGAAQSPGGLSLAAVWEVACPTGGGSHAATDYPLHYALTQPGVILAYLRLLVLPVGLNLDPDWPLVTSPLTWSFAGPLVGLLGLAGVAGWWVRRCRGNARQTLACCGVLWFFLTLGVDSTVIPLPDLMAEHRSYLPSAGLAIAIACLADLARTRHGIGSTARWLVPSGVAAALLCLAAATVARNQVWRSPAALWKDTTAKSPNKVRPWMNLGTAYYERERWSSAADCYRRAIRLAPDNSHAWIYLANTENAAGWHEHAVATAQEHLRRDPSVVELHLARAMAYERLGQPNEALAALRECLDHKPNSRRARLGIGGLSLEAGNLAEAARQLGKLRALGSLTPNQQRSFDRMEATITARKKLFDATR